jgi:hypothetical protein
MCQHKKTQYMLYPLDLNSFFCTFSHGAATGKVVLHVKCVSNVNNAQKHESGGVHRRQAAAVAFRVGKGRKLRVFVLLL